MLIFVEDIAQQNKLLANLDWDANWVVVYYRGLLITRIIFLDCDLKILPIKYNLFMFIRTFLNADKIVTEYANFIPRLASIIFSKKLISAVFGTLLTSSIGKDTVFPRLLRSQLAAEYWIFGRKNKTHKISSFLSTLGTVRSFDRKDFPDFRGLPVNDYILIIGQAWDKENLPFYEHAEDELLEFFLKKRKRIVYCRHPRSQRNYPSLSQVNGYVECIDYIAMHGRPILACSLSSSMISELDEMGVSALNLIVGDYLTETIESNFTLLNKYDI